MKKKNIANVLMVLVIALIAAASVVFVVNAKRGESAVPETDSSFVSETESDPGESATDRVEDKKKPAAKTVGTERLEEETDASSAVETEDETYLVTKTEEIVSPAPVSPASSGGGKAPETTGKADGGKSPGATTEAVTEKAAEPEKEEETVPVPTCTVSIRCDTAIENSDRLEAAKKPYLPKDGCILPAVTVEIEEGESVFEALKHVCDKYGIQLEFSWTPIYNSAYIEGIGYLYEFDCGDESGWIYKVNGVVPNYGCSEFKLRGGETVEWIYSCEGYGADVGAEW